MSDFNLLIDRKMVPGDQIAAFKSGRGNRPDPLAMKPEKATWSA